MPNGNRAGGGARRPGGSPNFINEGRWILLFVIIVAVILINAARSGIIGGRGGVRVGSPSTSGTVDETPPAQSLPPPQIIPPVQGEKPPSLSDSSLQDKISLYQGGAARNEPDQEYVELAAFYSNKEKVLITGLSLENSKGVRVTIGNGANLPYAGQANFEEPIWLDPGGRVYLITGQSPIGASFRTNLCAGYFAEFKKFEPRLFEECPRPENEPEGKTFEQACANFLQSVSTCRQPQGNPVGVTEECRNYVSSKINYKTCVDNHKPDDNFYKREWYVYFGRPQELWKDRGETIKLYDQNGKIIATLSY